MDKAEFAKLAVVLNKVYKKDDLLADNTERAVWYEMLNDLPYSVLTTAVHKWIATQKWSPSIAELRKLSAEIMNKAIPECEEAWEKVLSIARGYSPYDADGVQKQIDGLDDLTRQCLKFVDIRSIAYSDTIGVERAHFMKVYQTVAEREKTSRATPERTRIAIQNMQPLPEAVEEHEVHMIPIFEEPEERTETEFDRELRSRFCRTQ